MLSGGGNNGAWEAGVIYGFVNSGQPADFAYDVVTGVSAGAINTIALAGWEVGMEKDMATWLCDLWSNLKTEDVWVDWSFGGKVKGLTMKQGVVDNSPLLAFLQNVISKFSTFGRRVTLSAVDVGTGKYTEFDQTNIKFTELPDAAVSSASIPLVFPPHVWPDRGVFMDGGTVYNINIEGAVRQCMDLVDDESKIIMDVLICGAPDSPEVIEEAGNSWTNYFRGRNIEQFYGNTDSLAQSIKAHPTMKMRHIVK